MKAREEDSRNEKLAGQVIKRQDDRNNSACLNCKMTF